MRWMKTIPISMILCIFLSCAGSADKTVKPLDIVKVTTNPKEIYIEQGALGQYLNFDFVIENLTGATLKVSKVVVSVYDNKESLLLQKFLDSGNFSPSIWIIPEREVKPEQSLLIFNPFHIFSSDVALSKLRYEFTFDPVGQGKQYKSEIVVNPVVFQPKTDLILPLKGRLLIFDGHDFYAHHRRLNYLHPKPRQIGLSSNFMRYGEDFSVINEYGEKFKGDEEKLENWFAFGMPVYSTGDGKVAALSFDLPDSSAFNDADFVNNPMIICGNYIVIDHLNGEFSIFCHLKQGSSKVKLGETIKQDQPLAQVGSSGSAYFPHLHYELRTGTDLKVEGLPSYFGGFYRVLGAKKIEVNKGPVETGEIVERK
jgi:Peptidase family M23